MKLLALLLALLAVVSAAVAMVAQWIHNHRGTVYRAASRAFRRVSGAGPVQAVGKRFPRFWKFMGARLTPGGYLGLHLTVGLVLSLMAILAFGFVAYSIFSRRSVEQTDRMAATMVREEIGTGYVDLFKGFAFMGNGETVAFLGAGILVLLLVTRRKPLLIGWISAVLGAWVLESGLKMIFRRTRPEDALIPLPSSYSFPSGHALVSLVTYGMLAYLMWQAVRNHRLRTMLLPLFVLVILCIGLSRIYLGVHYFSDVMGGYAAGITWLAAVISGLEVVRRRRLLRNQEDLEAPVQAS